MYTTSGDHTVAILGGFERIYLNGDANNAPKLRSIDQWGNIGWTSMASAFDGASAMTYGATDAPDLSRVTDMSGMFAFASAFNGNISNWNVSTVTNMNDMFEDADSFDWPLNDWNVSAVTTMSFMFDSASDFNGDISGWNVSSVINMHQMFADASAFNGDISGWNTSHVTDMFGMFFNAVAFNQPLNSWDVSSVLDVRLMFNGATLFHQNLGNWYVVANATSIARADVPGVVAEISAQNSELDRHTPTYDIGDGIDKDLFEIVGGNQLNMTSAVAKSSYTVNVTASGTNVFENDNNWHVLEITVTDSANMPPTVNAGTDQTVGEGDTVTLSGTATDFEGDAITSYIWSDTSGSGITFINASSASTTFTAPDVTSDTTYTLRLTASDGTDSGMDSVDVLVKDTSGAFITTWRTTSAGESITIPVGGATGTYDVIWGDDTVSIDVTGDQTHRYATSGNHTVAILGGFERIYLNNHADAPKLRSIDQWGNIGWTSMASAFDGTSAMTYGATDTPDLSRVTDMSGMFYNADAFNGDISGWNVSGVTNMANMFRNADVFNRSLNGWNVSSVTDMPSMFRGAAAFNGDISNWNTSHVTDMFAMFLGAAAFNGDISSWNVSSVTNMGQMFDNANSFDQNLGEWYVVVNPTSIARADVPGVVAEISAQNSELDGHTPTYGIGGSADSAFFEIVGGNQLNMTSADTKSSYTVNVTASDGSVFENDNNWREFEVTVTGQANTPPVAEAGPPRSVNERGSITLQGSGSDPDGNDSDLTYSWSQSPATPVISFDDQNSATPEITAPSVTAETEIALTLRVDDGTDHATDTMVLTILDVTAATVNVGLDQTVREGAQVDIEWAASGPDGESLTYSWSQDPLLPDISLNSENSSPTTFTAPDVDADTAFIFTLVVTAGQHTVEDSLTITVKNNRPPTVNAGTDRTVNEGVPVTLSGTARDPDGDPLTYEWTRVSGPAPTDLTDNTVKSLRFTAPGVTSDEEIVFRFAATDDAGESAEDTVTITVSDVPITVSSATYNPGSGTLLIAFNQNIDTVDYSRLHVRSANSDIGGITLSNAVSMDISSNDRTITVVLDSDMRETYADLTGPQLVVEDGAVTDTDGDQTTDVPNQPIMDASQKRSSSSSKAPLVNMIALAQARIVDIPPHIAEQIASHDASDPLEPIIPDGTFDFPLVINGYGYLLDDTTNTLVPQTVRTGDDPVTVTFTVYTEKDLAHFTLYLNLQDDNTDYADSDTYITYRDDGTTVVTDPHGYIADATITVTQEDDSIPEKKTVSITIYFEEPMGPTNAVAYMWNTDRKAVFVKIIDALEVTAALLEPVVQAADPEPLEPDSVLPADPEPVSPDFADGAADPEPVPADALWPAGDYDEAQVLTLIRMWSGFESEMITDTQLLELLGLEGYQDVDLPDWMMTELGVLVARGDITVDEFMLALQYVLTHA